MDDLIDSVQVPEGKRGKWKVEKFKISETQSKMSLITAARYGRGYVLPGTYTKLCCEGRGIVMSDTPDERRDHIQFVMHAHGHVLINGLGLGMVLAAVLKKSEVAKVTVVEIEQDVVSLVEPAFSNDARVNIVISSAFDWQPPKTIRYGAVWHDIWDNICSDNLPEMSRLKRKYARKTDWQGCWSEYECRRLK